MFKVDYRLVLNWVNICWTTLPSAALIVWFICCLVNYETFLGSIRLRVNRGEMVRLVVEF